MPTRGYARREAEANDAVLARGKSTSDPRPLSTPVCDHDYADLCSTTFTKPSGWTTYELLARGFVQVRDGAAVVHRGSITIGGDRGSEVDFGTSDNPKTFHVHHKSGR